MMIYITHNCYVCSLENYLVVILIVLWIPCVYAIFQRYKVPAFAADICGSLTAFKQDYVAAQLDVVAHVLSHALVCSAKFREAEDLQLSFEEFLNGDLTEQEEEGGGRTGLWRIARAISPRKICQAGKVCLPLKRPTKIQFSGLPTNFYSFSQILMSYIFFDDIDFARLHKLPAVGRCYDCAVEIVEASLSLPSRDLVVRRERAYCVSCTAGITCLIVSKNSFIRDQIIGVGNTIP